MTTPDEPESSEEGEARVAAERSDPAAAVMFLYLVAVSVLLHAFWSAPAASAGTLQTHFFKNMGIAGGLLLLAANGPGRWTLTLRSRRE